MDIIKLFWLSVVVGLFAGGCRKPPAQSVVEIRDSIIVKEIPRIDTLRLAGDTIRFETVIECDSITNKPKPIYIERTGSRSGAVLNIASTGALIADFHCDSLQKVIESKDLEITKLHSEKRADTIIVPEYKTHWYDKIARIIALVVLGSALGLVAYIFLKLK